MLITVYGTCLSVIDFNFSPSISLLIFDTHSHSQDFGLTITDAFSCSMNDLNILDGNTGFTDGFPAVDVADK